MKKKAVTKKKDSVEIKIGKDVLELSLESLRVRKGVHKAVLNHVLPYVTKVLNDKI